MTTPDQNEAREAWENYAKSEGLVYDMPNSSERRAFMAGYRPPLPAPRDVEQAIKRLESRGFGERMDYFIGKQNGDALRLIFDAARRSPVPADTPSEDGPHSRACGPRKHDHGTDCHPNCQTCHGQAAPPTPPEDVAAAIAYLTPIAESATVGRYGEMLRVALAALAAVPADGEMAKTGRLDRAWRADLVDAATHAIEDVWADVPAGVDARTLAENVVSTQEFLWLSRQFPVAVPADGETEWAESLVNDGTHEFTVSSDCDGSNEKRWMRTPRRVIKAGPWLPIPESEEQR